MEPKTTITYRRHTLLHMNGIFNFTWTLVSAKIVVPVIYHSVLSSPSGWEEPKGNSLSVGLDCLCHRLGTVLCVSSPEQNVWMQTEDTGKIFTTCDILRMGFPVQHCQLLNFCEEMTKWKWWCHNHDCKHGDSRLQPSLNCFIQSQRSNLQRRSEIQVMRPSTSILLLEMMNGDWSINKQFMLLQYKAFILSGW